MVVVKKLMKINEVENDEQVLNLIEILVEIVIVVVIVLFEVDCLEIQLKQVQNEMLQEQQLPRKIYKHFKK